MADTVLIKQSTKNSILAEVIVLTVLNGSVVVGL